MAPGFNTTGERWREAMVMDAEERARAVLERKPSAAHSEIAQAGDIVPDVKPRAA